MEENVSKSLDTLDQKYTALRDHILTLNRVLEEEKYENEKLRTKRKENYKFLEARIKVLMGEEISVLLLNYISLRKPKSKGFLLN